MTSPRLLDLFCCAGGAGTGYARAGFDVTGVDINAQPRYPFRFAQGDALHFLAEHWQEFDAVHASPPCQSYTPLGALHPDKTYPDLVAATRARSTSSAPPRNNGGLAGTKAGTSPSPEMSAPMSARKQWVSTG